MRHAIGVWEHQVLGCSPIPGPFQVDRVLARKDFPRADGVLGKRTKLYIREWQKSGEAVSIGEIRTVTEKSSGKC